jgi:hypothetical protein
VNAVRQRSFISTLQLFFTPEALIPFLFGSVALSVLGNAVYGLLTKWLGQSSTVLIVISISALLILILAAVVLLLFVRKLHPSPPLAGKQHPTKRRGLILLVSNEDTCRKAIDWHKDVLEKCWLLYSSADRSSNAAETLRSELLNDSKEPVPIMVNDVYDPLEFRQKVNKIYTELPNGWTASDVIFDFTGMTACGSVGGVLACLTEERPIQYTPAIYNEKLKALQPLDPIEVVLRWGILKPPPSLVKEGLANPDNQ